MGPQPSLCAQPPIASACGHTKGPWFPPRTGAFRLLGHCLCSVPSGKPVAPVHCRPSEISFSLGFPSLPTIFKSPQRFPAGLWGPCRKRPLASPWPAFSCVKQGSQQDFSPGWLSPALMRRPRSLWHLTMECLRMAAMTIINEVSASPHLTVYFSKRRLGLVHRLVSSFNKY